MTDRDPQLQSSIRMLNQIAANLTYFADDEQAAAAVASHLNKFWARSMKQQIIAFAEEDEEQKLCTIAQRAVALLISSEASRKELDIAGP